MAATSSIGSASMYTSGITLQRTAQELPKILADRLLPTPVHQVSGTDSVSISSEGLARLQAEEQSQPHTTA